MVKNSIGNLLFSTRKSWWKVTIFRTFEIKSICYLGLSWEETIRRKPDDIEAACHNCGDSVTISGPPESVARFVKKLQDENIFAKEVKCSNFAFHSKYIADAGPKLRAHLERVSKN